MGSTALHDDQEGRFFHGYCDGYCYLPLCMFCGSACWWRSDGAPLSMAARVPGKRWTASCTRFVRVGRRCGSRRLLAADLRDGLTGWCEANAINYVIGLVGSARLASHLAEAPKRARVRCDATGEAAREFGDIEYSTWTSWGHVRMLLAPLIEEGYGYSGIFGYLIRSISWTVRHNPV
ncbi:transposase [Tahibacter sp.]|uniref:transposase n=1 Tax=Tahibacter sp. TaxID=2056211 RepID=UPI0028C3AFE4|nr:transposase [Tahibacter sp.]